MSDETAASAPPPLPPSPLDRLNDFSDKLSPMLVKELRQGLRTHTFVILFLVLQGFLCLILLTTAAADTNAGPFVSGIIFSMFSIAVLVVQPMRGMSAISTELKGDTIDLMALTKLSAWRIVFGKWSSIMGQTSLLLCAIIPYLILRYFFGEMQLFAELFLLFTIFVASGVLTAITVGLSATTFALIRIIPLLAGVFLFFAIFGLAFDGFDELLELFSPASRDHWLGLLGAFFIVIYIGYFFLELATTAIAPASQNRATRKRLIALLAVLLSFVILCQVNEEPAWIFAFMLMALLTLDLFTEDTDYPHVVVKPFQRFGILGRISARFLAPGWATGTLFFHLLLVSLLLLGFLIGDNLGTDRDDLFNIITFFVGVLNFNLLIVNLFKKRIGDRFVPYLLISILLLLLIPFFAVIEGIGLDDGILLTFSFLPHSFIFLENLIPEVAVLSICAFYCLLNIIFALREIRKLSVLEKELAAAPPTLES